MPPKKDVALPAACLEEADLLARWLPFVLPEVLPMIDRRLRSLFYPTKLAKEAHLPAIHSCSGLRATGGRIEARGRSRLPSPSWRDTNGWGVTIRVLGLEAKGERGEEGSSWRECPGDTHALGDEVEEVIHPERDTYSTTPSAPEC